MSGPVVGERELRRIAETAMRYADGDAAEALVIARTGALSRFANSAIHQNVASRECEVRLRVVRGTRVATRSGDRIDDAGLRALAEDASALARIVPEDPLFAGLPDARPLAPAPSAYAEGTALATPLDRARAVQRICGPAHARGLRAAGYVATNLQEVAVASTRGVWAYAPQTVAEAQATMLGDEGSAFAQRVHTDLARVDVDAVATESIDKALAAQRPRDLAPAEHEVVLEPYAVSDIVAFLAQMCTGIAIEEGRSFMGGRIGEQVTGPVTLVDDPFDPECLPRAFDFEGQPSERVTLIERGIARGVVYDSRTAHRANARNTGHALPATSTPPSTPMHRRLEAGDAGRDELIRSVKRGVLVTRFWYTRWVHQLRTIVTGMTRDGTFAIVDGEIAYPVKNFRFTQSYADALAGVRGIGRDLHLLVPSEQFGLQATATRVPALHLASFRFTGATQY